MGVYRSTSNEWRIGAGLRRSYMYGANKWMLWVNYGYKSVSYSWGLNPPRPPQEV